MRILMYVSCILYSLLSRPRLKVKGRFMGLFQHCGRWAYCILTPKKFPHSSPEAPRIIDARDLYKRRREILPMNFASKSVIYENPLSSFTCRKAGTWAILFTSPPKEGILRIFRMPEKSNGFGRV